MECRFVPASVRGWMRVLVGALLLLGLTSYTLIAMPAWAAGSPQPQIPGDANGDGQCTEVDALTALQMTAGLAAADTRVDIDGDARVTEVDALTIMQWAAAGGRCLSSPSTPPPAPPTTQPTTPPDAGPQITALEPQAAAVGDQVAVRGTGFTTQGILTLNSLPVDAGQIASWSDTEILFRLPVGALSGPVRVIAGAVASNALTLDVVSSFTLPQPADIITDTAGIERVKGQLMVGFQDGVDQATIDSILALAGGTVVGYDSRLEVYQLEVAGADEVRVDQIVDTIRARSEVEFVAPRFGSVDAQPAPNDPEYPAGSWGANSTEKRNWWQRYMRLPEAWDITQGSRLVPIAIVDTGFMTTHPDLQPQIVYVAPGNSVWNDPVEPHGTHVAGIAGAAGNNSIGVSGVNWTSNLLLYDWDAGAGVDVWDQIALHMVDAMNRGARVINLSAGLNWRLRKADLLKADRETVRGA